MTWGPSYPSIQSEVLFNFRKNDNEMQTLVKNDKKS